uniref:Uncharacterized protein n=1 Tax=Arundo donax TaxID=35708 RepID=A0A0A9EQL8_ARUDO
MKLRDFNKYAKVNIFEMWMENFLFGKILHGYPVDI